MDTKCWEVPYVNSFEKFIASDSIIDQMLSTTHKMYRLYSIITLKISIDALVYSYMSSPRWLRNNFFSQ